MGRLAGNKLHEILFNLKEHLNKRNIKTNRKEIMICRLCLGEPVPPELSFENLITTFYYCFTEGNENVDRLAKAALNGIIFRKTHLLVRYTSTPFGKKIGKLRGPASSTKYSPTWEKTSAKEVKEQVENGRR
ncbi:eukaryotic translation initiation factor 3 subunit f [Plakobranchus ocellatus]|uniref:Eukaryotic translation initiation factor 3 subunit f n=1 Tax=Plakobranchus ocellatus TaxID=259542 RepID=A0AAV4BS99_9GAST|nr:eukaryotic translation initiation factor 3 subunit f [Plakobranchus ocellatus]